MAFEERCYFLESHNDPGKLIFIENLTTIFVNIICSVIAITGNGIILVTFLKASHLRSPCHLLLVCLTFADFLTGFIVQPLYAAYKITHLLEQNSLSCFFRIIMETASWFSGAVSCSMFVAVTQERYFALHFHLRHHEVITKKRVMAFVVFLLVFCGSFTVSRFAMEDSKPFLVATVVSLFSSTLALLISDWKIYSLVRRHHRQIQGQNAIQAQQNTPDLISLRKSALRMALVASLYMIAYLPFTCVLVAYLWHTFTVNIEVAYDITRTIAFMTASWNPVLYCWKMADVREAVKRTFKRQAMITVAEMSEA